ncbi:MAG: protein kinase [Planctomycetes bacterium]|nr:protein kinase [Planctomycetota bacterium]
MDAGVTGSAPPATDATLVRAPGSVPLPAPSVPLPGAPALVAATLPGSVSDTGVTVVRDPGGAGPVARDAAGLPGGLRTIGPYELLAPLGEGGMGVVYRARQPELDRQVALKVMRARGGEDEASIHRFIREAQAAARLHHPGILPIFDVGRAGALHYYSMELVDGETLEDLAARERPTPRRALEIVGQVARALAHAHAQGVIHRDVKPQNILMARDGRALVADFGLAKDLSRESVLTQEGTTLGTPAYMAPEQALGKLGQIDGKSDVYSLGAVLYRLLTGAPPFTGKTPFEVVNAVLTATARPVRQVAPGVSGDIETVCMKCLEKEPARRYATAEALADDIGRFLEGQPIAARPPSLAGRLARNARRTLWPTLGAASLVVAAAVLIVGRHAADLRQQEQAATDRARLERDKTAARERLERANRSYQAALGALAAGEAEPPDAWPAFLERAAGHLDTALGEHPGHREARLRRAEIREQQGEYGRGAADLDALLATAPDDPEVLYRFQVLGDRLCGDEAGARFRGVVERSQACRSRLLGLGAGDWTERGRARLELAEGRFGNASMGAERLLARLTARGESDADLLEVQTLADFNGLRANYSQLLPRALKLTALRPRRAEGYRLAGLILDSVDREEESFRAVATALALQPSRPRPALQLVAYAYLHLPGDGTREAGLGKILEEITRRFPDEASGWRWLAKFYRDLNRPADQERALARAAEVAPGDLAVIAESLAAIYKRDGAEAARRYLEAARAGGSFEEHVAASGGACLNSLMDALTDCKEGRTAEEILVACRARFPQDWALAAEFGGLRFEQRRHLEAIAFFDEALAANPTYTGLRFKRARSFMRMGKYDKARIDLKVCVKESPANHNYRFRYGIVRGMLGDPKGALGEFTEALYATPLPHLERAMHEWAKGNFVLGDKLQDDPEKLAAGPDPDQQLADSVVKPLLPLLIRGMIQKGREALVAGDLDRAERSLTIACLAPGAEAAAYVELARVYARRHEEMAAILALESAAAQGYSRLGELARDPAFAEVFVIPRGRRLLPPPAGAPPEPTGAAGAAGQPGTPGAGNADPPTPR